jgi:hypothetical protein
MREYAQSLQTLEAFLSDQQYLLANSGGNGAFARHLLALQSAPQQVWRALNQGGACAEMTDHKSKGERTPDLARIAG